MSYILRVQSVFNISLQVLFVEAHGGDHGACSPVDHDIRQEVVKAEFSVQTHPIIIHRKQQS